MVFKKFLAAATALALVAAPEVALAQTNAAARAAAVEATPAAETVDGDSEMFQGRRRGFIIPLFAISLVILGLIIVFRDNDGAPVSP
ncbi:MAG TPA: hypothetical protein VF628_04205 [Allosphingosinicella sp.]